MFNINANTFTFPEGNVVRFRCMERDKHALQIQGHEYTQLCIDECVQFPNPDLIDDAAATLRSPHGIPVELLMTCNSLGPGNLWVKQRYITPDPLATGKLVENDGWLHCRIKFTRDDNPALFENDPGYLRRLEGTTRGNRAKQLSWIDGSWDVMTGLFFINFCDANVISYSAWIKAITRYGSPKLYAGLGYDHGVRSPFACVWATRLPTHLNMGGDDGDTPQWLRRGSIVYFQERYGADEYNEGLGWTVRRITAEINAYQAKLALPVDVEYADPMIATRQTGRERNETIKQMFSDCGLDFKLGNNQREQGWTFMSDMISEASAETIEFPALYITDNCTTLIEHLRSAPSDPKNVEDVDTDYEYDHDLDAARYLAMGLRTAAGVEVVELRESTEYST